MRAQVYNNTSLTETEKQQLLEEVANEAIFGIDAGRERRLRASRASICTSTATGAVVFT